MKRYLPILWATLGVLLLFYGGYGLGGFPGLAVAAGCYLTLGTAFDAFAKILDR